MKGHGRKLRANSIERETKGTRVASLFFVFRRVPVWLVSKGNPKDNNDPTRKVNVGAVSRILHAWPFRLVSHVFG